MRKKAGQKQGNVCVLFAISVLLHKNSYKKIRGLKKRGKEADVEHRNAALGSTAHPFSPA